MSSCRTANYPEAGAGLAAHSRWATVDGVTSDVPVSPPRAWAEIDLSALKENLAVARSISGCDLMPVVKAGAYGHGLEEIARALAAENIAFFGVANVGEARRIRRAGVSTRIYLLGATWAEEREEIVAMQWTPCLSSLEEARHFDVLSAAAGVRLKVHLSVDTGMGRGGFLADELSSLLPALQQFDHLEIEGIGSHLPSADEDREFTLKQFSTFEAVLRNLGGPQQFKWCHLSASAGLLGYDRGSCNLVRPGLLLYGVSPLAEFQNRLRNVMTLKSRVTLVRTLPSGHGVSYGREFITKKPTRVATVGIGYGDGYPRHVSGQGADVWIRGTRCPLIGRVTMDQVMVDVTQLPDAVEGDEVEMFGANIPVDEVAKKASTISWEVFTGITPRVTRVYFE
jgi:alanine racemase